MVRAGYGWFYTRIPQIYESSVRTGSELGESFLFLDAQQAAQGRVFPTYPSPLVDCGVHVTTCVPPASVDKYLTTEIYAFDPHFQTPFVQQASLTRRRK